MSDIDRKLPRVRERTRSQHPSHPPVAAEQVGYCKPPKSGQFKKGRSGNPKGRPRRDARDKTFAEILHERLHDKIEVTTEYGKTTVSYKECMAMRLRNKAVNGDVKAIKAVHAYTADIDEAEVNKNRRRDPNLTTVQNMILELLTGDPDAPD